MTDDVTGDLDTDQGTRLSTRSLDAGIAAEQTSGRWSDFTPANLKIGFACLLGLMLAGSPLATSAISLAMVPLSAAWGWSRGEIGGAVTAWSWAGALAMPFLGRHLDKRRTRGPLIALAIITGVLTVSVALQTGSLAQFYAIYLLLGLSGATIMVYTKIVAAIFTVNRGKALALFTIGSTLIVAAFPQVMRVVFEHSSWRGIFLVLGLATLVVAVPVLVLWLKDPPDAAALAAGPLRPPDPPTDGATAEEARRSATFWLIVLVNVCGGTTIFGLLPHLVAIMTSRGLSLTAAVGAMSLSSLFVIVGQFSIGFVMDRFNTVKIAAPYMFVFGVGVFMLSIASGHGHGEWLLYGGVALMGTGGGAQLPFANYVFTRYFGMKAFGEIAGLSYGLSLAVSGLSPALIGIVYDRTGSYTPAFAALVVAAALNVVIYALVLPRYRYSRSGAPAA